METSRFLGKVLGRKVVIALGGLLSYKGFST